MARLDALAVSDSILDTLHGIGYDGERRLVFMTVTVDRHEHVIVVDEEQAMEFYVVLEAIIRAVAAKRIGAERGN